MRRADKIRLAQTAAAEAARADTRDARAREAARKEWGLVRKTAREAFLAGGDWMTVLNEYRDRDGFYTAPERERMVRAYMDELIMSRAR